MESGGKAKALPKMPTKFKTAQQLFVFEQVERQQKEFEATMNDEKFDSAKARKVWCQLHLALGSHDSF